MKTTLFVELGYQCGKIALYNSLDDQLHFVDITGGYGKQAIPLHMQKINEDGTILIGEDAIGFDIYEENDYYSNVLDFAYEEMSLFLKTLSNKVSSMMANILISDICLITNHDTRILDMFEQLKEVLKLENLVLSKISFNEAVGSFAFKHRMKESTFFQYFDDKQVHLFGLSTTQDQVNMSILKSYPLELTKIDDFYMDYLINGHSVSNEVVEKGVFKLYFDQMITLYSQLHKGKEVSVYSSLQFPPIRIKIVHETLEHFLQGFVEDFISPYRQHLSTINRKKTCIYSGAYDKKVFIDRFMDTKENKYTYEENCMLLGGFYFIKNAYNKQKDFIDYGTIEQVIGFLENDQFVAIVTNETSYLENITIPLIMTDYEDEIKLYEQSINGELTHLQTINIESPKEFNRIKLVLGFNEGRRLEEVSYELRKL